MSTGAGATESRIILDIRRALQRTSHELKYALVRYEELTCYESAQGIRITSKIRDERRKRIREIERAANYFSTISSKFI